MTEFAVSPIDGLGFRRLAVEVLTPRAGPWWVRFRDEVTGAEAVIADACHETRHYRRPRPDGAGTVFSALIRPSDDAKARQVLAADVRPTIRGRGLARRAVYTLLGPTRRHPLRVGLTVHLSAFSSTPHSFEAEAIARAVAGLDTRPPQHRWEEVFFFRLPPGGAALVEGYGWTSDGQWIDLATRVVNGAFVPVPLGYHRVASLPPDADGEPSPLAYWWAYLALDPSWEKRPEVSND